MTTATISVNGRSHAILCGICDAPIAILAELQPDGTQTAGCVACGNIDTTDKIGEIAKQYVIDTSQIALNRLAADAARKSKLLKFSGKTTNDKTYRFTVDLQP